MKTIPLILLTLFLPLRPASAEALGFQELLKLARARSESVGLAREGQNSAEARKSEALGEWLPQLTLKTGEAFADLGNRDFQSPFARLNLRQDIFTGLNQLSAIKAGDALKAEADAQLASASLSLENDLGKAYFKVLQQEEELEAERAVLKLAQDSMSELKSRVELGRNRKAELSSAMAQVARVQATLAGLEGDLTEAREELSSLCGIPVDQALAALSALPDPPSPLSEMEARIASLPALEALRQNLKVSEALRLAAKGAFLPSFFVEGNWNLARQNAEPGNNWDANVGLDLPLFRGGALLARLKLADAALATSRLNLQKAEREASRELKQAWHGLNSSLSKVEASRLALEAAEQSYKDQIRDFKNALVTSLDLLNAFQSVETSRLDHLRARYDAQLAALRLRLASGSPFN